MAKKSTKTGNAPALQIPDFIDVDAESVRAAMENLRGATGWARPESAKQGKDDKQGGKHWRWQENGTITQAYRTVTKKGLLDATLVVKGRAGSPNEGAQEFLHFYINNQCLSGRASEDVQKKHGTMTEQAIGTIGSLLKAVGLMPESGAMKASLLSVIFPSKNEPGKQSPLVGKSLIVNAHGSTKISEVIEKDETTGVTTKRKQEEFRIQADSFLPDDVKEEEDEEEEAEEEEEVEEADEDEDEDDSDDDDEDDDEDEDDE